MPRDAGFQALPARLVGGRNAPEVELLVGRMRVRKGRMRALRFGEIAAGRQRMEVDLGADPRRQRLRLRAVEGQA